MHKIAITTTSFAIFDDKSLRLLKDSGFDVILNPFGRTFSGDEIVELVADSEGLIAGTETLDGAVLKN